MTCSTASPIGSNLAAVVPIELICAPSGLRPCGAGGLFRAVCEKGRVPHIPTPASPSVLTAYLAELQRVALLTPDEERELWHRYRVHGEAEGRRRLIEAYQPLVFKVVMQVRPPEAVLMDMLQEGTVGLIEAVERFDHTRGIRFSTFAPYRIRGRVLNALRRCVMREYSLEQEDPGEIPAVSRLPDPSSEEAFAGVEEGATVRQLHQAIEELPTRERAILRAAYVELRAPRKIAADLQISLSHFYRLHKQALDHMRALVLDDVHLPRRAPGY